jgi:hypothetical protein
MNNSSDITATSAYSIFDSIQASSCGSGAGVRNADIMSIGGVDTLYGVMAAMLRKAKRVVKRSSNGMYSTLMLNATLVNEKATSSCERKRGAIVNIVEASSAHLVVTSLLMRSTTSFTSSNDFAEPFNRLVEFSRAEVSITQSETSLTVPA